MEVVNNHLGDLQEDLAQVTATVESLVANQTGASKAMSFARRADEHVNEQGKMFQASDNKLEAQAQLLEELQMKIIVSNEEVRAQIASCIETTHTWDKRLAKFDMTLVTNESNNLLVFPLTSARKKVTHFTEEKRKWQIEKSQNTKGQSKMLNQLRDDTVRYKSEAELSKQTASSKQQQAAALATTTLSEHKQMGLDTVAISIDTEEESTPVGLIIEANDGVERSSLFGH